VPAVSQNVNEYYKFPLEADTTNQDKNWEHLVTGSYEGCIVDLHFYFDGTNWKMSWRVHAIDTIVDPVTQV